MKLLKVVLVLCSILMISTSAFAGINITSAVETSSTLDITWGWSPETYETTGWTTLTFWEYEIEYLPWCTPCTPDAMYAMVHHLDDPHTPGTDGGDYLYVDDYWEPSTYGMVVNGTDTLTHTAGHLDQMTVTFNRNSTPANSTGVLSAVHVVPEPISSTLFFIGGVVLGFRRMRKTIKNVQLRTM